MIRDVTAQFPIPVIWPRLLMPFWLVDGIAVHHTVTFFPRPDATVEEELNHIAMIHEYHKWKGFLGIGYHMVVFPSGRVYLVAPLTQWGAHVEDENNHLFGIAVIGDFTTTQPGGPQVIGVAYGISYMWGFLGRRVHIGPHQEWQSTTCPGNTWDEWSPRLFVLLEEENMVPPHYHTPTGVYATIGWLRHGLTGSAHDVAHALGSEHGPSVTVEGLQDIIDLIDERVARYAAGDQLAKNVVNKVFDCLAGVEPL